jgi:hypothetical protein
MQRKKRGREKRLRGKLSLMLLQRSSERGRENWRKRRERVGKNS